jgi:hypothetical protein
MNHSARSRMMAGRRGSPALSSSTSGTPAIGPTARHRPPAVAEPSAEAIPEPPADAKGDSTAAITPDQPTAVTVKVSPRGQTR